MGRRLQLQELLELTLGSTNVYFQPPRTVSMLYPAIVYNRDYSSNDHANNALYRHTKRWQVTVIDRDPDSLIPDKIETMQLCSFVRHFNADGLNHDIFDLYF